VVLDLDGFKEVNDRHGHAAGDRVLQELAASWSETLRGTDVLARFGGDEFTLLLPGVAAEDVGAVIARLPLHPRVGWSWGATEVDGPESLPTTLARADRLMYDQKVQRAVSAETAGRWATGSSARRAGMRP
jgi:diguanylate cyclase (GGDEF)-like protein